MLKVGGHHYFSQKGWFLIFVAPTILILGLVIFIPLGRAIYLAMTDYNLIHAATGHIRWIGLTNFKRLLSANSPFWAAFFNTLIYTFASVSMCLLFGLIAALVLNQGIRFINL